MPYAYYAQLSKANKAIYRQSAAIETIPLENAKRLRPIVRVLEQQLALEQRSGIEATVRELCRRLLEDLDTSPVTVKVLAARPSHDWGELHGLYEPAEGRRRARITVWMRTAQQKKVVAFKAFLRTVLHELCHHIDYELFGLEDSFHTEGFFKRESSLFRQIMAKPRD
jgi:hypothetical protein